ncbi:aspartic proteinase cdr1 [Phtheirospermum japonicum]|uniref:Aspartic proteinase cdr1 n=1 Tax=Phtheirospermum japonicum TaxID=374723 RepID=A0A830BZD5_9LAMI|nr:aspartic proteinase cdr1 [Phtheirospermum japonicum]
MTLKPVIGYLALISIVSLTKAITAGFTIDLIQRDSLQSPFHNPSLSPLQCRLNAIRRSFQRIQRFKAHHSKKSPKSELIASSGEYLMKYSVGTPPVPSFGIADTGSDIIWTQCPPCLQCFNQTLPTFAPKKSSTYKRIPCKASTCTSLGMAFCSKSRKNCLYYEGFGDGSFTLGELLTDAITLPSTNGRRVILAPNIIIGCGFINGGMFSVGESGVVGLGGGNLSLVRQLGSVAEGKFSYCLISQSGNNSKINSGRMSFGAKARVSGKRVVSTPLVHKDPNTYYFLTLEGTSVGNSSRVSKEGNVIIDSGTVLTFLPKNFYTNLVRGLNSSIELRRIKDPQRELDLCFFARRDDIEFPQVVFHFKGADVKLRRDNVFVRTSDVSLCLAAVPVPEQDIGIYGNLAQINFLVGYDLEKKTVSFKPADCVKY